MASQTLPVVTGDKDRSLQEVLSRLTSSRAPAGPGGGSDRHGGAPAAGGRRLVCAVPRGDRRPRCAAALAARGIEQLYTHQAEAFAARAGGRNVVTITPTASGKTLCYNAPVLERDPQGSVDARAVSVSDQGAGAGSARRAARAVRSSSRDGTDTRDRRVHLRRRHAAGRAARDSRQGARGAEQPRHAALGHPAAPSALGEAVRESAVRRDRRAARLSRRVRQPSRRTSCGGCSGSAGTTARIRSFICSSATIANPRELAEGLTGAPVRAGRQERRAARREVLPVRQSAGRQRASSASAARIWPKRAASRSSS